MYAYHYEKGLLYYLAFVLLALLSDRRGAVLHRRRSMQRDGDTDARDTNENHRHQVDDDEQQQEETATKITQIVEAVGTDLARRNAILTVDCKGVTVAVQVR